MYNNNAATALAVASGILQILYRGSKKRWTNAANTFLTYADIIIIIIIIIIPQHQKACNRCPTFLWLLITRITFLNFQCLRVLQFNRSACGRDLHRIIYMQQHSSIDEALSCPGLACWSWTVKCAVTSAAWVACGSSVPSSGWLRWQSRRPSPWRPSQTTKTTSSSPATHIVTTDLISTTTVDLRFHVQSDKN